MNIKDDQRCSPSLKISRENVIRSIRNMDLETSLVRPLLDECVCVKLFLFLSIFSLFLSKYLSQCAFRRKTIGEEEENWTERFSEYEKERECMINERMSKK